MLTRDADTCTPPGPITAPCDPGKATTFTVNPLQLSEGPITFSAVSRDLAGNNSQPVTWTVRLDRTPPAARASGDLLALTSQHTNSTTPTSVTLQGRDAASGVARLQLVASNSNGEKILADRDTCTSNDVDATDGACPHNPSVDVTIDPADLPDGSTTFIARAIDHASIRSVDNQDWDTYVDHTPPDPPDSISISQTSNTSVQVTWPTVVDQPLGSGNVSYEYLITAGGQPVGGWRPTTNPHAQVSDLPPGVTISVQVRAVDGAGNIGGSAVARYALRGVGPVTMEAGTGRCVAVKVFIGQHGWTPFVDSIWSPGGLISTLATVTCGFVLPVEAKAVVKFPEFHGRVCLDRNVGRGWARFGLCTPFHPRKPKVRTKVYGKLRVYEVTTPAPDIGNCTLHVQGTAQFRTVVVIKSRISVDVKNAFLEKVVSSRDDRTEILPAETQHCPTELEGWDRLAKTNPQRPRRALKSEPEAILGTVLGNRGQRDTRPVDSEGSRAGWEAHHIVPAGSPRAIPARISAFRCHVHPNSKLNGIWLRAYTRRAGTAAYDRLNPDQKQRVLHSTTFSPDYYARINDLMAQARSGDFGCDRGQAHRVPSGSLVSAMSR